MQLSAGAPGLLRRRPSRCQRQDAEQSTFNCSETGGAYEIPFSRMSSHERIDVWPTRHAIARQDGLSEPRLRFAAHLSPHNVRELQCLIAQRVSSAGRSVSSAASG